MTFPPTPAVNLPENEKKRAWPELTGSPATQAVQRIAHDRPDVAVEVLPLGSYVPPGYNPLRVRVHIDGYGLVDQEPIIG